MGVGLRVCMRACVHVCCTNCSFEPGSLCAFFLMGSDVFFFHFRCSVWSKYTSGSEFAGK